MIIHESDTKNNARTKKPVFWLPSQFSPSRYGTPAMRSSVAMFTGVINGKAMTGDTDQDGWVYLKRATVERSVGKRQCSKMLKALLGSVVERTDWYMPGIKTYGYKIKNEYYGERLAPYVSTHEEFNERYRGQLAEWIKLEEERTTPWIEGLKQSLRDHLSFDPGIDAAIDALPKESKAIKSFVRNTVDLVRNRDTRARYTKYGRLFSPLTGLKKTFRPFVRLAGEPVGAIDLSAAQWCLLACIIDCDVMTFKWFEGCPRILFGRVALPQACRSMASEVPQTRDFAKFKEACLGGFLYELLTVEAGLADSIDNVPSTVRDRAKKRSLVDVLARKGKYEPSSIELTFMRLFPSVHQFITFVNVRHFAEAIRLLQTAESCFVLHRLARNSSTRFRSQRFTMLTSFVFETPRSLRTLTTKRATRSAYKSPQNHSIPGARKSQPQRPSITKPSVTNASTLGEFVSLSQKGVTDRQNFLIRQQQEQRAAEIGKPIDCVTGR